MSLTEVTVMEVKIDEIIYSMWSQRISLTQVTVIEVKMDDNIIYPMWSQRMFKTQVTLWKLKWMKTLFILCGHRECHRNR